MSYYLVTYHGAPVGRFRLSLDTDHWIRWALRRHFADYPGATAALDPDQESPHVGPYRKVDIATTLRCLLHHVTVEQIRAVLDDLTKE